MQDPPSANSTILPTRTLYIGGSSIAVTRRIIKEQESASAFIGKPGPFIKRFSLLKIVGEILFMRCFRERMINFRGKHIIGLLNLLTQAALPAGKISGYLQTIYKNSSNATFTKSIEDTLDGIYNLLQL